MQNIALTHLVAIARRAGEVIMSIYNDPSSDFSISRKEDNSPLTIADKASHNYIAAQLASRYPDIPILSEEGVLTDYEKRRTWQRYWCVDPLDGTKEFIKRNGEFTVNIALIQDNQPVMGVIYIPATDTVYFAARGQGVWKQTASGEAIAIESLQKSAQWTAAGSRSHGSEEEERILSRYPVSDYLSVGSSIKFCLLAEGSAQIYLRLGPTMEWDTAAGQIIAETAGCTFTQADGSPFEYNKRSLLNPPFLCKVKMDIDGH